MTIPVGVVGAGFIGQRHVDVLQQFADVDVVAVADVDRSRSDALAARCGAKPYEHWAALLEHERLAALFICVPPFAHGDLERAAAELGIPMFIEKPLSMDLTL